jgi:hypothetical protein
MIRWAVMAFVTAFAGAQLIRPDRTNPPSRPAASLLTQAPSNVAAILERSCRDCHSNQTTWPWYSNVAPISWTLVSHVRTGRDNFNYSEWTSYDDDDQDRLLGAMCNLTKRGRMPLPSYLLIHRDAKLSPSDIEAICSWSEKMRDTLQ